MHLVLLALATALERGPRGREGDGTPTIALVSCGPKHLKELGTALVSLTVHAPGAHVLLFADEAGRQAVAPCLETFRRQLRLDVHPVASELPALADDGRFHCASAKVLLQAAPALRRTRFVLVMDVDTVALEPLSALWAPWTREMARRRSLWGMALEASAADAGRGSEPLVRAAPFPAGADRSRCAPLARLRRAS